MALFEEVFNQIGPAPIEGLTQGVIRGTLSLAIAGFLAIALHKRATPAVRHMIWTLGIVALLLAPMGMVISPGVRILPDWSEPMRVQIVQAVQPDFFYETSPASHGRASFPQPRPDEIVSFPGPVAPVSTSVDPISFDGAPRQTAKPQAIESVTPTPVTPTAPSSLPPSPAAITVKTAAPPSIPYKSLLFSLWLAGFILCIAPVAIGYAVMLATRIKYRRVSEGPWHELLNSLRKQLRIRRPVSLLRSKRGGMPMTWGIFFPQVVLPEDSFGWTAERKRIVILHELAHVRRWDTLTQLLAQIACALFWFNPLVWYTASRMRIERELACDDLVLRAGCRPSDYAEELLAIAAGFQGRARIRITGTLGVPMASAPKIEGRVRSILDLRRRPGAITGLGLFCALVSASAILVPSMILRAKSSTPAPALTAQGGAIHWLIKGFSPSVKPTFVPDSSRVPAPAVTLEKRPIPAPAVPEPLSSITLAAKGRIDPGALLPDLDPTPAPQPAREKPVAIQPAIAAASPKLQKQLDTLLPRFEIQNQALDKTLASIADQGQFILDIDWPALEAAGVHAFDPVRYLGQNVSYADILKSILTQAAPPERSANRPVFVAVEETVRIAPRHILQAKGISRDYDLRVLLAAKNEQGQLLWDTQALINRIKEAGEPGDWDVPGFAQIQLTGTIAHINAPQETHDRIRKIIATVSAQSRPRTPKAPYAAGVSAQPLPETLDLDPAKTLVLNNAPVWNEVGWLNGASAVSAKRSSEGAWSFTVADLGGAETWYRHITSPVLAERYPFLVVRYRAIGLDDSGPYGIWMDDGVGPNMGGFSPLITPNFISDGTIREVRADVRLSPKAKSNNPGPLAGSLAVGVHAAPGQRATFEIIQVRFEADPAAPNAPVILDQAAAFNIVDDLGKPIQGASVRAMADYENLSTTAHTDTDGNASVSFARPPSISLYTRPNRDKNEQTPGMLIQVSKEGYGSRMYRIPFPLPTRIIARLDPVASARGRVLDISQKPVENVGVMIEVHNAKTNQVAQRTALTDKDGLWVTDPFPIGLDWHVDAVRALDTRYIQKEWLDKDQYGKLSSKELTSLETTITLSQGVTLSGRVMDENGKPVPNCAIECLSMSGSIRVTLNANADTTGRYTIGPIAPGQARMVFRGGYHQPAVQMVYIAENIPTQYFNTTLARSTPIRGRLVDRHGKPVVGAWVRVRPSQNGPAAFDSRTDNNGQFTYPNAPDKVCKVEFILEEGIPFYVVEMPTEQRLQTITLYSGHATVSPLVPRVAGTTDYFIRSVQPIEALRRDLRETLGIRHIRSDVLASNVTLGAGGTEKGAIQKYAIP